MFTKKKIISHILGISFTYLIYCFPYDILISFLSKNEIFRLSSLIQCLVFYIIINLYFRSEAKPKFLRLLIFEGMGIGFISLSVTLIALTIKIFFNTNDFFVALICFTIIISVSLISIINGHSIRLKTINISSNKVKKKIKLIFISDVHLGSNSEKHLQKIFNELKKINFDILLIGGDLIDLSNFNIQNLKILNLIKKPILFVTGNHEHYLSDWNRISLKLSEFNIRNIDGKTFKSKELNIIGVGDNMTIDQQQHIIKNNYKKEKFNIILAHKPSVWMKIHDKIDLMLAGHTHKGQIFPFYIFVRLKFNEIYGIYKKFGSTLFVSSGAGCWGPKMRLGSQNEVVKIIIE